MALSMVGRWVERQWWGGGLTICCVGRIVLFVKYVLKLESLILFA